MVDLEEEVVPTAVVAAAADIPEAAAVKARLAVPEEVEVVPSILEPIHRHRPVSEMEMGKSKYRGEADVEIFKITKYSFSCF